MIQHVIRTIAIVLLISQVECLAQAQVEPPVDYHKLIEQGIAHFDKGEYDEAIKIFSAVHRSDPMYPWACYELALTLYNQQKLPDAADKCREALQYEYEEPSVYALLGSILDDLGDPAGGVAVLLPALKRWPYNQNLMFNLAYCYVRLKEYDRAEAVLLKSIRFYPYHAKSHSLLARVNFAMGRTAQAYYAFNMAMLMNPNTFLISEFENAITGDLDGTIDRFRFPYPDPNTQKKWNELKWLMESELAFSKDYKFSHKVDYLITRKTQMLLERGMYEPSDTSLYNQLYVRFYNQLMANGHFETYVYYLFQNVGLEHVNQWNARNKDKISAFVSWAQTTISNFRRFNFNLSLERSSIEYCHFGDNGLLWAVGRMATKPDSVRDGHWVFVNNQGGVSEEGDYRSRLLEGSYKVYWDNANVKQDLYFRNDKLHGTCTTFHRGGAKSGIYGFKEGLRDGLTETYTTSGHLENSEYYKEGRYHGPSVSYNYQEGLVSKVNYTNGAANGLRTRDWINGNRELEFTFRNDTVDGPYKAWYENGGIRQEGRYINGVARGLWNYYHWNGHIQSEGKFDSLGRYSGMWTYYYPDGNKYAVEDAYLGGSLNGTRTEYYRNGRVSSEFDYVDNRLMKLVSYDTLGRELYSALAVNDVIGYRSFYPDGTLQSEGQMDCSKNQKGLWKYYDPHGFLKKEFKYNDGMLSDLQKTYYANGGIHEEYSCDSNKVDGLYKEYFVNGKLASVGWVAKGLNQGEWLRYYPDGTLKVRSYYLNGDLVGYYTLYAPDGSVEQEHFYDSDKNIRYLSLYGRDGKLSDQFTFMNGNGVAEQRYKNGSIRMRRKYLMGQLHDTISTYYGNGKPCSQIVYLHGKPNGISRSWDVLGNLTSEVFYVMGKEDGPHRVYQDGVLVRETNYSGGTETGVVKYYHPNGKLYKAMSYPDGERTGYTYYYSPEGVLMYRAYFVDGAIKFYSYLDPAGKYVKDIPFDAKTPELIAYYPNGRMAARLQFANGEIDGKRVEYYTNGMVQRETDFRSDCIHGTDRTYSPAGKLIEETHYYWDNRHGAHTRFYENGTKRCEGRYVMDEMDGPWRYYDPNGRLIALVTYRNGELVDNE